MEKMKGYWVNSIKLKIWCLTRDEKEKLKKTVISR